MMPLPAPLGGTDLLAWRLDEKRHAPTWDSGEGAYRVGGRWNSRGVRCVYCSLDPSTAILEVAVHKGFNALNAVAHLLTAAKIIDCDAVHVVMPEDVPNRNWLFPGAMSKGQQEYGDELLAKHKFVVLPSTVSTYSWNLIFLKQQAQNAYALIRQERFSLDTRLDPR